jgi:hypothetical protein
LVRRALTNHITVGERMVLTTARVVPA